MTNREKERAYIRRHTRLWTRGQRGSPYNIGCSYRLLGQHRLAFQWWKRAAEAGDDSAWLAVGYCYQHGAGVRKHLEAAARAYRRCIAGYYVAAVEREEAQYLLATMTLMKGGAGHRRAAIRLLEEASRDGDYPEASNLIDQIRRGDTDRICTCYRFLRPTLKKQWCPVHRRR